MRNDAQTSQQRLFQSGVHRSLSSLTRKWRLLTGVGLMLGLMLGLFPAVHAAHATDSYYTTVQQQLQTSAGLSNAGTFAIADTDSGVFAHGQPVFLNSAQGTTPEVVTVSGQAFAQALQLSVPTTPRKNWYLIERFTNTASIQQNDIVHLVFWMRSIKIQTVQGGLIQVKLSSAGNAWGSRQLLINGDWTRIDLPMKANNAADVGNAYLEFFYGYQVQTVQIGGVVLLNYGQESTNLGKLPKTPINLDYPGHDPNASWRSDAEQRIDKYRKANLQVVVKDQQGNLVPSANVAVHMTKQAFQFSNAATNAYVTASPNQTYIDKLLNTDGTGKGFNMLEEQNGLKWQGYEDPTTRTNVATFIQWAHDHGIAFRGHNLVWPCNLPDDINKGYSNNGIDWLTSALRNHVTDEASHYGNSINEWDVINEPYGNDCLEWALQSHSKDYIAEYGNWFQLARNALGSGVPLYLNDDGVTIESGADMSHYQFIHDLTQAFVQKNAPVDGLGLESHFDSPETPLTDPTVVYSQLSDLAALKNDLKLKITEFDIKLDTITDPAKRAQLERDYTRDFMTIAFSIPQMTGFQIWNMWDGDSWINYAPLFYQDWSVKPSGQAYLDLVYKQWWTDTSGSTDANGSYSTRGFKGNYTIDVSANGQTQTVSTTLDADQTVMVTLGGSNPTPTPTATVTPMPTPIPTATMTPTSGGGLPAPWQTQDIGSVNKSGSASFNNNIFTVAGSGSDIWSNSDAFRYAYQPLNGDGTIIARVESVQDTDSWAKAGVMIRETLDPSSAHAMMALTPGNGATFQYRTSTSEAASYAGAPGLGVPYWVKLVRQGNTITGYISDDGSYWSKVGSNNFSMGSTVYVGLAVTSHNNQSLCSASFSSVSKS